jgi:hypothetical protein
MLFDNVNIILQCNILLDLGIHLDSKLNVASPGTAEGGAAGRSSKVTQIDINTG